MLMYFQKAIFYGFECLFIKHLERKAMKTFIKVITVTSVAMQLLAFSGPSLSRSPNSPNHQTEYNPGYQCSKLIREFHECAK